MRKLTVWIPSRGDIVWMDFLDGFGSEQKGRRPAIILTSSEYNAKNNVILCCPITSKVKGYSLEVPIDCGGIVGVILPDQVQVADWRKRHMKLISHLDTETQAQVRDRIIALISE